MDPRWRQSLFALGGLLAPLAAMAAISPSLPYAPSSATLAFSMAALSITLSMLFAPKAALLGPRVALPVAVAGAAMVGLSLELPPVASGLSGSLGLACIAAALGSNVGGRMAEVGHILPVALMSSAVDLWSVTSPSGVTHRIVQNPALLRLLTVSVAMPPSREPSPAIGFGDVAFAALYLAASERFGLSRGRTAGLIFAGLVGSGVVSLELGRAVPALPLMGLFVVLGQPAAWRVSKPDRAATWAAAGLLVFSIARALTR